MKATPKEIADSIEKAMLDRELPENVAASDAAAKAMNWKPYGVIRTTAERMIEAKGRGHPSEFYQAEIKELRQALGGTCSNCKHWKRPWSSAPKRCDSMGVRDMLWVDSSYDGFAVFETDADFGCNRWEEVKE